MASPPEQPPPQPMDDSPANNLILTLRQVSISPGASDKQRTFSLREFEILQTIGELCCQPVQASGYGRRSRGTTVAFLRIGGWMRRRARRVRGVERC